MNSCEILMVAAGDWCMHAMSICMVKGPPHPGC